MGRFVLGPPIPPRQLIGICRFYIFSNEQFEKIGPSGVRALPLAAGINVGGHYKGHFLLSPLSSFFRLIANSPRRGYCRVSNFCMGNINIRIPYPPNRVSCLRLADDF
jgi:hypothetical protein